MFDPILARPAPNQDATPLILTAMAVMAIGMVVGCLVLAKNFNRWTQAMFAEGGNAFDSLKGRTGRTTTVLNPSGIARFGDREVKVGADDVFEIDPGALVEVVDVRGAWVLVKQVAGSSFGMANP